MSGPVLIPPGFFGKLPRAGDFVSRRLPSAFVGFWDPWVSRYLAGRPGFPPLCFLHPATPVGSVTGAVLPSRDRAGRRFPLTLAAFGAVPVATEWYTALLALGGAAARGDLDAEALATGLETLTPPFAPGAATHLLLWRPGGEPEAVDPTAPEAMLDALLAPSAEAG